MPKPLLFLALDAPLQSWGVRARWDVRDTASAPTKSGIMGLLACSLGYPRGDPEIVNLDMALRMGVRVEREGSIMRDYHTVTEFLPTAERSYRHSGVNTAVNLEKLRANAAVTPSTIVSSRQYIEDAFYLVVLECIGEDESGFLSRLDAALRNPKWPLFLGRRACVPTRPVSLGVLDGYESIGQALEQHPWTCRDQPASHGRNEPAKLRVIQEAGGQQNASSVEDQIISAGTRLFGRRFIKEFHIPNPSAR